MKNTLTSSSIFAIALLTSAPALAVTTGFTAGNDFGVDTYRGTVQISCDQGFSHESAYWTCDGEGLSPAEYSYFTTDPGGSASEVKLTATREDGSTYDKTEDYDPAAGKTKGAYNLWISTLFQRPLLKFGVNHIHYEMLASGTVEKSGDFTATVKNGKAIACDYDFISSFDLSDCRSPSAGCNTYFRRARCDDGKSNRTIQVGR